MSDPQLMFDWAKAQSQEQVEPSTQTVLPPEVEKPESDEIDRPSSDSVEMMPDIENADDQAPASNYQPYSPGHPWHYLPEGDGATPLPPDKIETAYFTPEYFGVRIPKNRKKRDELLRKMLGEQREQLEQDIKFYRDVVERGVEALSRYDREIAYGGNDQMAVACTIALKYNHIASGKGRVAWLEKAAFR